MEMLIHPHAKIAESVTVGVRGDPAYLWVQKVSALNKAWQSEVEAMEEIRPGRAVEGMCRNCVYGVGILILASFC